MLKRNRNGKIISSDGWSVESISLAEYRYCDKNYKFSVGGEFGGGDIIYVFYPESIKFSFFSKRKKFQEGDVEVIWARFKEAFKFIDCEIIISGFDD